MGRSRESLLQMVDKMPAFPASVHRIVHLTSDVNCQARDLVRVIDTDPVLTMRILRVANSAYFGLQMPIVSVKHAVVYIGMNTVKHLALATAAIGALPTNNKAGFDADTFLEHSLGVAIVTRRLSRFLGVSQAGSADQFVAGLLHDIGQVLFANFEVEGFAGAMRMAKHEGIPGYVAEREIIGVDHADIGAMLAEHWGFPSELCDAIREHHEPIDTPETPMLRDCVFVANVIASRIERLGLENPMPDPPDFVLARFGLGVEELLANMAGLDEELEHTLQFR